MGSPQVARDSSSAALTQGPAPDCSSVSEEGPEGSPGNTPKLAAILAAPAGVGTRTHALGLQRDSQKKHIRGPLLHVTLIRGPGNYSPDHSRGPQADPGEGVGAVRPEAAGGSGAISRCWRGEQSRYSPSQLFPEAAPSHPGPRLALQGQNCPESNPRLTSTLLGTQLGGQGWLGVRAVWAVLPRTSPCGAWGTRSPGSGWLLPLVAALTCSL